MSPSCSGLCTAGYVCADGSATQVTDCTVLGTPYSPVAGNQLSGTFTVTLRRHTTIPITFDAADTEVKTALEALPNIGTVIVNRTGPSPQRGCVGHGERRGGGGGGVAGGMVCVSMGLPGVLWGGAECGSRGFLLLCVNTGCVCGWVWG